MKKILTTPLRDEDLEDLKIGDVVYLTGRLVTCRDVAHRPANARTFKIRLRCFNSETMFLSIKKSVDST